SDQLQARRVQPVRQFAHASRDALRDIQGLSQPLWVMGALWIRTDAIETDGQDRELLTDVVVQFTANAGAFRLLFAEEPLAKVPDSVVADAQLDLAVAKLKLGATSLGPLHEEAGDQRRLRHDSDQ